MPATHIAESKVECVLAAGDVLGETPLWCDRSRKLWWIDIDRRLHHSLDPGTGQHTSTPHDGQFLGSHALTHSGSHLLAKDLAVYRYDPTSAGLELLANVEQGTDNRLNDGRVDARGRLWIGTMDNALHRPSSALYRVDPDGGVTRIFSDVIVTNGIAFSPDSRVLYFTDTRRYQSWQFDLDIDGGRIGNRRLFADYTATGDRPDGACVDVDGCLWTAFFAGSRIARYRPDGEIDIIVEVPAINPTCVCFGGNDLRTLFITSATKFLTPQQRRASPQSGSVFAIAGLGEGLPEHRFGK
jgi:sugar lactone lactonase YvrE